MLNANYLRQVLLESERFEDSANGLFALIDSIRVAIKPMRKTTTGFEVEVSMMDGEQVVLTKSGEGIRVGDEFVLHFRDRKPRFPVTLTAEGN